VESWPPGIAVVMGIQILGWGMLMINPALLPRVFVGTPLHHFWATVANPRDQAHIVLIWLLIPGCPFALYSLLLPRSQAIAALHRDLQLVPESDDLRRQLLFSPVLLASLGVTGFILIMALLRLAPFGHGWFLTNLALILPGVFAFITVAQRLALAGAISLQVSVALQTAAWISLLLGPLRALWLVAEVTLACFWVFQPVDEQFAIGQPPERHRRDPLLTLAELHVWHW
jgi:hypothetical protein